MECRGALMLVMSLAIGAVVGEIVDIDGPTGGYNLTLAFATARAAVCAIAARLSANRGIGWWLNNHGIHGIHGSRRYGGEGLRVI